MAKIADANKRFVADLLEGASVEVPDYQRSYSWDKDELTELWDDLTRFERRFPDEQLEDAEYFIGSVVAIRTARRLRLLDGQQRFATLTIFLAAIRDAMAAVNSPDAAGQAQDLHQSLIQRPRRPGRAPEYRLSLGIYDRAVFAAAIQEFPRAAQLPASEIPSHRLIAAAKYFFDTKIREAIAGLGPAQQTGWLERMWNVIGFCITVVVVVGEEEEDATEVFETLNDRGVGLTTVDLLRNFLLGAARSEEDRRLIIDWWLDVFGVSDNASRVQIFLRHFWISRYGDVKARGLYKEIKRSLQDQFTARTTSPRDFSSDLATGADVYRALLAPTTDDDRLNDALEEIDILGANSLYPVLMAALQRHTAGEIAELGQALVSLYVRWSVIGRRESTVLEQTLFQLAPEIYGGLDLADALERVRAAAPNNETFEEEFETASLARPGWRRHVLVKLETRLRRDAEADEVDPAPPARLHVEHLYPQTPASEDAEWEDHEDWVNRIGNLTLLHQRWNAAIRNGDFRTVKLPRIQQSVILLNDSVKNKRTWNQRAVEQRQRQLAELAPRIWAI